MRARWFRACRLAVLCLLCFLRVRIVPNGPKSSSVGVGVTVRDNCCAAAEGRRRDEGIGSGRVEVEVEWMQERRGVLQQLSKGLPYYLVGVDARRRSVAWSAQRRASTGLARRR